MQVLAVLERNLVVVEPHLETVLHHANEDFCVTGSANDSDLVYDVVGKAHAIERAKVFLSAIALLVLGILGKVDASSASDKQCIQCIQKERPLPS